MGLGYNFDNNRNIRKATIQGTQFTNTRRLWGSIGSVNTTPALATSTTYTLPNGQPEARGQPSAFTSFPILGLREHSDTPNTFPDLLQEQVIPPLCSLTQPQPSAPCSQQPHDPGGRRVSQLFSNPALLSEISPKISPDFPRQSF